MQQNNRLIYTTHARQERMQQRGAQTMFVELVRDYGECAYLHNGCQRYFFTKKSFVNMAKDGLPKSLIVGAEKKKNLSIVITTDSDCVVTVVQGHCIRRSYH